MACSSLSLKYLWKNTEVSSLHWKGGLCIWTQATVLLRLPSPQLSTVCKQSFWSPRNTEFKCKTLIWNLHINGNTHEPHQKLTSPSAVEWFLNSHVVSHAWFLFDVRMEGLGKSTCSLNSWRLCSVSDTKEKFFNFPVGKKLNETASNSYLNVMIITSINLCH